MRLLTSLFLLVFVISQFGCRIDSDRHPYPSGWVEVDQDSKDQLPGVLTGVYTNFERSGGEGESVVFDPMRNDGLFGLSPLGPVDRAHIDFDGRSRLEVDLRYEGISVGQRIFKGSTRDGWFEAKEKFDAVATEGVSRAGTTVYRFHRVGPYLVMQKRSRDRGMVLLLPYLSFDRSWQRARIVD